MTGSYHMDQMLEFIRELFDDDHGKRDLRLCILRPSTPDPQLLSVVFVCSVFHGGPVVY